MKSLLVLAISLLTVNSFGYTKTATFGLRMNHAIVDGTSAKDLLKFQGGVIVGIPLNEAITFRTGGLLVMKDSEIEVSGFKATVDRLFIDAPATLQFGNETVQGYAGVNVGLKLSSSCKASGFSSCTLTDEKSLVFQPILGLDVAVASSTKVGFFYEFETEYQKNWKQSAYGLQAGFDF